MVRTGLIAGLASLAIAATAEAQGRLVVLNKGDATASVLDIVTGETLFTLPTGDGPHEVAVSADGQWAVAANYGAREPGKSLSVLDLRKRAVARLIDLGDYRRPHGLAWLPDGKRLLVTVEQSQAVLIVDVAAGRVDAAIATGQSGTHMVVVAPDGKAAFTANIGSGSVTRIDMGARKAVRSVVTGKGPEAIDISPDGRELWAADRTLDRITILNAATLDTLGSPPTDRMPNRLKFTPDGKTVVVSNAVAGTMTFYDVAERRLVHRLTFPFDSTRARPEAALGEMGKSASPLGILLDPGGKRAWVATATVGEVVEVDLSTRTIVRALRAGTNPDGLGFARGGR